MNAEIKDQDSTYSEGNIVKEKNLTKFHAYKESLLTGVAAFIIIFSLNIIFKFFANTIGHVSNLRLSAIDLVLSLWGFIIFSVIVFLNRNRHLL